MLYFNLGTGWIKLSETNVILVQLLQHDTLLWIKMHKFMFKTTAKTILKWQLQWNISDYDRYMYNFRSIVSTNWQINKRFLISFLPNHNPYSSYNCTKLGKESPLCVFGLFVISLHYVLQYILASAHRVETHNQMLLHDWVTYILLHPVSYLIVLSNLCI